ncbi:hypothetical protein [Crocosphaera sp.]|uniref:hypothetical protein n=1 Tax=Crocosphaera sp. TaxID=2729996 RepID=UPI002635C085|nr:hypothetical protein [Crocosphaera sp.]MDJ0579064.1 hypothetical protein [Crocosphaera sp.]
MTNIQNNNSTKNLVESWFKAEKEGVQFPVPFDTAWKIAGYSKKANAKRRLSKFVRGKDFCSQMSKSSGGRQSEVFYFSCNAFTHFCLLAETQEGRQIRDYYIECQQKWQLVQQHHPSIAEDIETLRAKEQQAILEKQITLRRLDAEVAKYEAQKEKAIAESQSLRYTITQTCPEPVQQKVLGYSTIEKVEYRDRTILNGTMINDGTTLTNKQLCQRYGIMNKRGNPDTTRLSKILNSVGFGKESGAWEKASMVVTHPQFKREFLKELDQAMSNNERQLFLGE